ncbi:MAG: hypothetical protein HQM03_07870 [Magnetococcales bacterium]|nr:hypothetical protein [Magnetococcales bacterium]
MTTNNNLTSFFRGDTKAWNLEFKDGAGNPIDITNHVLWFTMKRTLEDLDENAALQKRITFPPGAESESGKGTLLLTSAETGALRPGSYFYDLQKVIPENPPVVATIMSGKVVVQADITRDSGP